MEKLKALFNKYREIIAYVFFGGVTTLVNWGTYFVMHTLAGIDNTLTNVVAWILAVLVAYFTNRRPGSSPPSSPPAWAPLSWSWC